MGKFCQENILSGIFCPGDIVSMLRHLRPSKASWK